MRSTSIILCMLIAVAAAQDPMDLFSLFKIPNIFNTQQSAFQTDAAQPSDSSCNCLAPRKKREARELEMINSEDLTCNDKELREIILKNIQSDVIRSKQAIYSALRQQGNFVVICHPSSSKTAFATRSEKFCSDGTKDMTCLAFQL